MYKGSYWIRCLFAHTTSYNSKARIGCADDSQCFIDSEMVPVPLIGASELDVNGWANNHLSHYDPFSYTNALLVFTKGYIKTLFSCIGDESAIDPEHELHRQLFEPMRDCSRQRLRSLQMGLRKYANIDSRITVKELQQVFTVSMVV